MRPGTSLLGVTHLNPLSSKLPQLYLHRPHGNPVKPPKEAGITKYHLPVPAAPLSSRIEITPSVCTPICVHPICIHPICIHPVWIHSPAEPCLYLSLLLLSSPSVLESSVRPHLTTH